MRIATLTVWTSTRCVTCVYTNSVDIYSCYLHLYWQCGHLLAVLPAPILTVWTSTHCVTCIYIDSVNIYSLCYLYLYWQCGHLLAVLPVSILTVYTAALYRADQVSFNNNENVLLCAHILYLQCRLGNSLVFESLYYSLLALASYNCCVYLGSVNIMYQNTYVGVVTGGLGDCAPMSDL